MEIVVVDESGLRVIQVANEVFEGALLDPRGSLETGWGRHINHGALVAWLLHDFAAFLVHGLKERSHERVS